jgi:hypothetical protein
MAGHRGRLTTSTPNPFGRALVTVATEVTSLRLRAAGLRFISAAGIQAIIRLTLSRQDLRESVDDANATFQRCRELLDLHRQLPSVQFPPAPQAGYASANARSSNVVNP